jgi:hypothetical protein
MLTEITYRKSQGSAIHVILAGQRGCATLGMHTMAWGVFEHKPDVGMHDPWCRVTPRRGAQASAPPWQPLACPYTPEGRGAEGSTSSSSYMPAR